MILRSVFVCFRSLNHNDKVLMMWRLTRQVRITSITTLFKTAYLVAKFSVPKIHAKFIVSCELSDFFGLFIWLKSRPIFSHPFFAFQTCVEKKDKCHRWASCQVRRIKFPTTDMTKYISDRVRSSVLWPKSMKTTGLERFKEHLSSLKLIRSKTVLKNGTFL